MSEPGENANQPNPPEDAVKLNAGGIITPEQARKDMGIQKPETDWKAEARKWEDRAKENKRTADENRNASDELAKLKQAQMSDQERLTAQLTEAQQKAEQAQANAQKAVDAGTQRLIHAEVRALAAAQGFRDPHDAIAQLRDNLGSVEVTDDGVDTAALTAALADLAEKKPYLIDTKQPVLRPDLGQGARLNSPDALSQAEYEQFYPTIPTRK